jgi:CubicO group peptidase (beta-lactamase class C family)
MHTYGPDKKVMPGTPEGPMANPSQKPAFLSGSGGLASTTGDYFRFAQMLLNGGELDGARILKSSTIELMRTNVLNPGVMVDLYGPKEEGIGFGLDFAIVLDPAKAETPRGVNTFYWGGAFGTWFWVDPTNDVVVIGMIQNLNGSNPRGGTPQVRPLSAKLVYAALADTSR